MTASFPLIKMEKLGDHLGAMMWASFNHLNEKINSLRLVARNFSFKKLGLPDMVNNRVDLTANRSINKYSSSGLGSLSHMAAPKWDGRKSMWQGGVFPPGNSAPPNHVSLLVTSGAWITH